MISKGAKTGLELERRHHLTETHRTTLSCSPFQALSLHCPWPRVDPQGPPPPTKGPGAALLSESLGSAICKERQKKKRLYLGSG